MRENFIFGLDGLKRGVMPKRVIPLAEHAGGRQLNSVQPFSEWEGNEGAPMEREMERVAGIEPA